MFIRDLEEVIDVWNRKPRRIGLLCKISYLHSLRGGGQKKTTRGGGGGGGGGEPLLLNFTGINSPTQ